MAIRMEKDPEQGPGRQGGGGGGGGNTLLRLLPIILLFLFKRPKLLIPVLIIGGVWYFFLGGSEMLSGGYDEAGVEENGEYFFGAALSEERYDKAQVFEPLAYGAQNRLPAKASLEQYAPRRLHQGRQGSCVGWAAAYGARTILQSAASGVNPDQTAFSPAYLYNQIALQGCQGAYMLDAMKAMQESGSLPFSQFSYDERSCAKTPDASAKRAGQAYRIKGFNRLTLGGGNYKPDILGIKQHLAQGAPVVIGMQVGGSFMSRMLGQKVWRPNRNDYSLRGFSGHAMCVIGYDDNLDGGAFQIMNSWGEDWGDRGIAWVRYPDFEHFVKEAYGLHPMGATEKFDENKMAVEFGLLDMATKNTLGLRKVDEATFETLKPIRKGDKFKILISNSIECYVYVFGQESNGSSYVLFPYTEKHSPYCGITGTRLFPKDYSMTADEVGNRDYIAIVITKQPVDYNQLNARINSSRQKDYSGKLRDALADQRITAVSFHAGASIAFSAETKGKNAVGMVIAFDKR
jgi:hypothetical protein